jgi:hypothetical protein
VGSGLGLGPRPLGVALRARKWEGGAPRLQRGTDARGGGWEGRLNAVTEPSVEEWAVSRSLVVSRAALLARGRRVAGLAGPDHECPSLDHCGKRRHYA